MAYKQFRSAQLPKALSHPILVDANGLPRYWATIWGVLRSHELELSTEAKKLRYIESFYIFADDLHESGYLDTILGRLDLSSIGDIMEAYFISLRNRSDISSATETNWQTCLGFVKDIVAHLSKANRNNHSAAKIEPRLHQLNTLYGQLRIQKTRRPDILRSLPAEVVSTIYDLLNPEATNNPFKRSHTRWNVFLAFICMLHLGLRRGELLLLPVDCVKSSYDDRLARTRYWLNIRQTEDDEKHDSRYNKPGIKNAASIRQVPVSEKTAALIQTYVENYRGAPSHPFLFNSLWDTPLSQESVTDYFQKISKAIPPKVIKILNYRTGKLSVTPHDLRHTCAVVRLNQFLQSGDEMDLALQKMRVFFGWSRASDMPRKYARAVFEDRLSSVWSNVMDDRVALLRSIPKGV